MSNITISVGHKNGCRTIEKANKIGKVKKEKRDGLVDSPNYEIGMYGLYLEEIMSKI